ncbi:MAG TPA: glycosyltransferase family 4 protein [Steroidobacter sp.]|uniref:glycosyltransferase family 4 protein n=1 Tax=Steroidobacter sp. TaxID=1978227 RepID=UPI002ED9B49E
MRIVYLHQYFLTPQMSGTVRSYQMARRLVEKGHEVHMVTTDQEAAEGAPPWRESIEDGIKVHWAAVPYDNTMSYPARLRSFFTFAWRAARKAAQLQGDVIFATSTPLTIALPAVYASWRCRRPMVFEVRDLWPAVPIAIGAISNPVLKAAARWLERFAYRNSEHVVALAPGMRDEIVATGYPQGQVSVIPNGCDFDLFCDESTGRELRERHAWLGERPLLVYTGTFTLLTGTTYLAKLAAAIAKIDPELRIVGVGAGRDFEASQALATQLGVLDKNLFLLGKRPKREAAAWVQAADATLALFTGPRIVWRDAVQNKFFDSLAAGKPIINNFPGWQAQVASEAGAGMIISDTDIDAAARDVVRALRDRVWLESAGRAASELARSRFDRDQLGADLARILERVHATASR